MLNNKFSRQIRENPVFIAETRRIRWLGSEREIRLHTYRVIWICIIAVFVCWLLGVLPNLSSGTTCYPPSQFSCIALQGAAGGVLGLSFLLGFVASFLFDLYYVILPINDLQRDMSSGQWDLLQLTHLSSVDILTAKYAVAQLRASRGLAWEVGLRIASLVLLTFLILLSSLGTSWLGGCISIPLVLVLGFCYVRESPRRVRSVLSIGIAVAVRVKNNTMAILVSFGVLLAMRLAQFLMLWVLGSFLVNLLGRAVGGGGVCLAFLLPVCVVLGLYGFYELVEVTTSWQAFKHAHTLD